MAQTNILLETGTNELEIVEFYIDEPDYRGYYGINVAKVVEIIREQPVTAMPEMRHPSVMGAFLYRNGRVVPLIDLSVYLGGAPIKNTDSRVIITEFNMVMNSFIVSGVNRIHRLSWLDIEPPGKFIQTMSQSSITGVVKMDDRVVFILDLEAIVAELHPSLAIRMDETSDHDVPEHPYKILHADDSASIRKLIYSLLGKEGRFEVTQAVDGQGAWDLLMKYRDEAIAEDRPITDFIEGVITDIEMPNLDGLTLCKQIKEDSVLKVIPVAVFSSLINNSLITKCKKVGADAQFAKPDLQSLSDSMYSLIKSKELELSRKI
ncbi:chemotaxis protein CheV [Lawsonia intracellularis]|uniref:chemotaxis protein n=1 Tax=Lawsonia intracellularis TaxID=29546 RepID=UPI000977A448|nr:chemotaxis protein [Lawsonia intracellularis]OMQ02358.1 chemotaxis protein CheV [Lawsonia intracellularis]